MKNKITATIEFSFKGQVHSPSVRIDLDELMENQECIPPLYNLIARENNIGEHSYEYEVIHEEEIQFNDAEGLAAEYLDGSHLDIEGFEKKWRENKTITKLSAIAKQEMNIDDLNSQPELKRALIAAYEAGNKLNA